MSGNKFFIMLNSEQNDEVCDARDDAMKNKSWNQNKKLIALRI